MSRSGIERSASATSTLSCITVENDAINSSLANSSTPPTSINEAASEASIATVKEKEPGNTNGRARRSRQSAVSYNENVLAGTARPTIPRKQIKTPAKNDSEETLVPKMDEQSQQLVEDSIQVLNLDWSVDALPGDAVKQPGTAKRTRTRLGIDKDTIANASSSIQRTATVLGKRSRDAVGAGLGKLQDLGRRKSLRPRVQAPTEKQELESTPSKRIKLSEQKQVESSNVKPTSASKSSAKKPTKKWLSQGLYVGQDPDFDPRLTNARNQKKKEDTGSKTPQQRKILPMPMFAGKRMIETGRSFRLPFNVFSPLPMGQPKPEEWRKTRKSEHLIGSSALSRLTRNRCVRWRCW